MSTVLDVLRKAEQEGGRRWGGATPPGDPPSNERPPKGGKRWALIAVAAVGVMGVVWAATNIGGGSTSESEPAPDQVAALETQKGAAPVVAAEQAPGAITDLPEPPAKAKQDASPERSGPKRRPLKSPVAQKDSENAVLAAEDPAASLAQGRLPRAESAKAGREALLEQFRARRRSAEEARLAKRQDLAPTADRPEGPIAGVTGVAPTMHVRSGETGLAPSQAASPEGSTPSLSGRANPPAVPAAPPARASLPAPSVPSLPAAEDEPVVVAKAPDARDALRRPPSDAPQVRINILQWSLEPSRRVAYLSIEGGAGIRDVREGEPFEGLTVKRILPEMVEFSHNDATFLLRAN